MAISIKNYIDITTKVVNPVFAGRDFSGLVFTTVTMKTGASKKSAYEGGEVVTLSKSEAHEMFSDTGLLGFIDRYFGYSGGMARATKINIAYVKSSDTTMSAAFTRVTKSFVNFGAFAYYGKKASDTGITQLATANNENEYGWVFVVATDTAGQSAASSALDNQRLTHLTHADAEILGWYASVNYNQPNASGTADYKQFSGATATVEDDAAKTTADGLKVNYIGKVQNYGTGMEFYQTGVNMDGTDLGVVRDSCWLNQEITAGYFNLQTNVQKLPANYEGAAMVRNIITSVALRAIDNGVILIDKPLTATQEDIILSYTQNEGAIAEIRNSGYYIDVKIVPQTETSGATRYVCQYTLVYSKGDHIGKVEGLHVLV